MSQTPEDEWLKKAIDQLKSGIPFFVKYIGKIELPRSIAEEPDPEYRIQIVSGCLRKVAQAADILEECIQIPCIAENFLENAKIIIKNTDVQLSIYDTVFTIGDHLTNKFYGRHKMSDIAFAHLDSEMNNVLGYYALERKIGKPDARFYYVIQSESGIQVLAAMKLAFTVYAEKKDSGAGDVDVFKIAESMTPSPSTPTGAYCLLRLSTPSEDGTGFVHQVTPIDSDKLHQQVKIMALSDRSESRILQNESGGGSSSPTTTTSIQNITNIYLNMEDFSRINPFNANVMYPDLLSDPVEIPESLRPKKKFKRSNKIVELLHESHESHENDDDGGGEGGEDLGKCAAAPPLAKKSAKIQAKLQEYQGTDEKQIVPILAPPKPLPPPLQPPREKSKKSGYDAEIQRLRQKERDLQDRIRQIEKSPPTKSATSEGAPIVPPRRRKKKTAFRSIKESIKHQAQKFSLPLKKKLGNLRLTDYDENTLASDYSSLNSQSLSGSISSYGASSDASSEDSGVQDDLFIFPEAPENTLHWTNKLFRKEKKLHLSLHQFTQLSQYLEEQPWFHGTIHRVLAESRLVKDGEFLVRQSSFQPGQFIVTALRNRTPHHICVVNQQGQIRSHAGEFSSVIHLIQFHFSSQTPLCSRHSAVLLKVPVLRPKYFPRVTS